jgi:hypothetical protein
MPLQAALCHIHQSPVIISAIWRTQCQSHAGLQVTEVDLPREIVTDALVLIALAILIPFSPDAPEVLDSMQQGIQSQLLGQAPVDPSSSGLSV